MLELIESALPPARRFQRNPHITLSGGWDSRLLSILARRRFRGTIEAWTTSTDDGNDQDLRLSAPVAQALGFRQHVHLPQGDPWPQGFSKASARLQYQTWFHTWLIPLIEVMHPHTKVLIDGLAGDVLLKNLYVPREAISIRNSEIRRRMIWSSLSRGRLNNEQALGRHVGAIFEERSRETFRQAVRGIANHPAAPTLQVLLTRTTRVIAQSPLLLFGPDIAVKVPFLNPHVLGAALSISLDEKHDGKFYRRMLLAADRTVGALPSTNDINVTSARGDRHQTSASALEYMRSNLAQLPDHQLILGADLVGALGEPEALRRLSNFSAPLAVMQWGTLLSSWHRRYASRLRWTTPG